MAEELLLLLFHIGTIPPKVGVNAVVLFCDAAYHIVCTDSIYFSILEYEHIIHFCDADRISAIRSSQTHLGLCRKVNLACF